MTQVLSADTDKNIAEIFLSVYNRITPAGLISITTAAESADYAAMHYGNSGQNEARKLLEATVLAAVGNMLDHDKENVLSILARCMKQVESQGDLPVAINFDKIRVASEFGCVVVIDQKGEILTCALHTDGEMETDEIGEPNWCVADMPEPEFAKYVIREFSLPKNHYYRAHTKEQFREGSSPSP